jgi:hypothetical protein
MKALRPFLVAFTVFGGLCLPRPAAAYDPTHSALRVFPYEGRPGSTMYVSGYGLAPNTELYILFACPNYFDPHSIEWGNTRIIAPPLGPKTDAQGQFSGWTMKAPHLNHVTSSGCTVYAQDQTRQTYGPAQLGTYYILGPKDSVLPCDVRICIAVSPTPKRVHSGRVEYIGVQAWGGAVANVVVTFPGYGRVLQTVDLDWNGSGRARIPVPKGMGDTSHVRISVQCKLGQARGSSRAEFSVVH